MVVDINAIQGNLRNTSYVTVNSDEDIFREIKDDYVIQAVANLGQRLGIKGDSVTTKSFLFRDLFPEAVNPAEFSEDTHIGVVERRYGIMYLSIVPRSTLRESALGKDSIQHNVINTGNIYVSPSEIEIKNSVPEYPISYFKPDAILAIRDSQFIFCGVGLSKNASGEFEESEFLYLEFDKASKKLVNGLRLLDINGQNVIIAAQSSKNRITIDTYNLPDGEVVLKNQLKGLSDRLHEMNGYEFDDVSKTYEERGVSNEARINQMSVSYWLSYFRVSKYSASRVVGYIPLDDSDKSVGSHDITDFVNGNEFIDKFGNKINTVYKYFAYDEKALYKDLTTIYSQALFSLSNQNFKEQILVAIFNRIYDRNPHRAIMYVPIDYEFVYYCNSNDSWKIYGSINDVNVRFSSKPITPYSLPSYYTSYQILANISGEDRSALYEYNVEYSEDSEIVYRINVDKKYTLPYINSDNYWVINDRATSVKAKGEDAGNPNIIIIYNFNKHITDEYGFKILSAADKKYLKCLIWETKNAFVPPIEQINIEDPQVVDKGDVFGVTCRVPSYQKSEERYKEEFLVKLRNSIIINVCSVNCFDNPNKDIIERYGEFGVVTTFWTLDEESMEFKVIENPSFEGNIGNVGLDIIGLTNLNNLVKWHIKHTEYKHPDRYKHKWVVFENANLELKNNENDFQSYIYPVMMNKSSVDFDQIEYNNDLNFVIKYSDLVTGAEDNDVRRIGNTKTKYLTDTSIPTLNSLYYQKNGLHISNYFEYTPNVDVPIFNSSELLVQDINMINRANIISFNQDGDMYYSYIGTAFDDFNKNIIHFGSSKSNINLGEETMVDNNHRDLFKRPTKLAVDFYDIYLNGETTVQENLYNKQDVFTYHINWEVAQMYGKTVYKTEYIPESKFMMQTDYDENKIATIDYDYPLQFNNETMIKFNKSNIEEKIIDGQVKRYYNMAKTFPGTSSNEHDYRLWIPAFYIFNKSYISNKIIYLGDILYLPGLLCKLHLGQYCKQLHKIKLTSNMDVITYNGDSIMLVTSNRFIKTIKYDDISTEKGLASMNINPHEIYVGNALSINYFIDNNYDLHLVINENVTKPKIENLFRLKLNY